MRVAPFKLLWLAVVALVTGIAATEGRTWGKGGTLSFKPRYKYHRYKPRKPKCKTIQQLIETLPRLSGVRERIEAGPLTGAALLPDKGPFTVFLPSEDFFVGGSELGNLFDNDLEFSKQAAASLTVRGVFSLDKLKKLAPTQLTTLAGTKIGIKVVDGAVNIVSPSGNVSPIVPPDIPACDGVILIEKFNVLVRDNCLPVIELPRAVPELSGTFPRPERARVGLKEVLNEDKDFTVLAPSDDARTTSNLVKVTKAVQPDLKLLARVRQDHVVRGAFDATELKDCQKLETIGDTTLIAVVKGDKVQIEAPNCGTVATIMRKNVPGCNGLLHVIDNGLFDRKLHVPGLAFPPIRQCNLKRCFPPKRKPRRKYVHPRYYGYKKRHVGHRG